MESISGACRQLCAVLRFVASYLNLLIDLNVWYIRWVCWVGQSMGMQPNKANLFSAYLSRVRRMKDESDVFYILLICLLSNFCLLKWIKEALLGVLVVIAHALHLCRWRRTSMLSLPSPLLVMVSGIVLNPDCYLCETKYHRLPMTIVGVCVFVFHSLFSRFADVPIIGELLQPKQFFQWRLCLRSLLDTENWTFAPLNPLGWKQECSI